MLRIEKDKQFLNHLNDYVVSLTEWVMKHNCKRYIRWFSPSLL